MASYPTSKNLTPDIGTPPAETVIWDVGIFGRIQCSSRASLQAFKLRNLLEAWYTKTGEPNKAEPPLMKSSTTDNMTNRKSNLHAVFSSLHVLVCVFFCVEKNVSLFWRKLWNHIAKPGCYDVSSFKLALSFSELLLDHIRSLSSNINMSTSGIWSQCKGRSCSAGFLHIFILALFNTLL